MAKKPKLPSYKTAYIEGTKPPAKPAEASDRGREWWLLDDEEALDVISANLEFWAQRQKFRIGQLVRYMRIYGNVRVGPYTSTVSALQQSFRTQFGETVTYPVSTSGTNTMVSKITRNKPVPYSVTNNGDYKAQRRAKNRNIFIQGSFYENKTYELSRTAFRDSLILGDGFIQITEVDGRARQECVPSYELFVDELEAAATHNNPRQMHRIQFEDRNTLKMKYPEKADLIENDHWADAESYAYSSSLADLVCVRTSWHLPSFPGAEDGKMIKSLGSGLLCDPEPYTFDRFPFSRISYQVTPPAYWAQGLIAQGEGIQLEINRVAYRIQRNNIKAGEYKIWIKNGSNISADQLTNDIGAIIESDEKPEEILINPVPAETYQYIADLMKRWYEMAGISAQDATSMKPPGEQSGEAIRLTHDLGTERFAELAQRYEEFVADVAHLTIMVTQKIVEDNKKKTKEGEKPPSYTVNAFTKGVGKVVDFDDLGFEEGEPFCIQSFPVSTLPFDPAGREQEIIERVQAGWLDPDMARYLSDYPDTGRIEGLHNAQREFVYQTLDSIIEDGTSYVIDPYDNVQLFLETALEYYQKYKLPVAEVSEVRLQRLRDLIDQARKLSMPPPAPAPMGPPSPGLAPGPLPMPTPQGTPERAPQSQLLPFRKAQK